MHAYLAPVFCSRCKVGFIAIVAVVCSTNTLKEGAALEEGRNLCFTAHANLLPKNISFHEFFLFFFYTMLDACNKYFRMALQIVNIMH